MGHNPEGVGVVEDGPCSLSAMGTPGNSSASVCTCCSHVLGLSWLVLGGGKGVWGINDNMKSLHSIVEATCGDVFECLFCISSFH